MEVRGGRVVEEKFESVIRGLRKKGILRGLRRDQAESRAAVGLESDTSEGEGEADRAVRGGKRPRRPRRRRALEGIQGLPRNAQAKVGKKKPLRGRAGGSEPSSDSDSETSGSDAESDGFSDASEERESGEVEGEESPGEDSQKEASSGGGESRDGAEGGDGREAGDSEGASDSENSSDGGEEPEDEEPEEEEVEEGADVCAQEGYEQKDVPKAVFVHGTLPPRALDKFYADSVLRCRAQLLVDFPSAHQDRHFIRSSLSNWDHNVFRRKAEKGQPMVAECRQIAADDEAVKVEVRFKVSELPSRIFKLRTFGNANCARVVSDLIKLIGESERSLRLNFHWKLYFEDEDKRHLRACWQPVWDKVLGYVDEARRRARLARKRALSGKRAPHKNYVLEVSASDQLEESFEKAINELREAGWSNRRAQEDCILSLSHEMQKSIREWQHRCGISISRECDSCRRLFPDHGVRLLDRVKWRGVDGRLIRLQSRVHEVQKALYGIYTYPDYPILILSTRYMCHNCISSYKKGELPKYSHLNVPLLEEIPPWLKTLTQEERRCLTPYETFMTVMDYETPSVRGLPKHERPSNQVFPNRMVGGTVNVPVHPVRVFNVLPRRLDANGDITIECVGRRQLHMHNKYMQGQVSPKILFEAADLLFDRPLFKELRIDYGTQDAWKHENHMLARGEMVERLPDPPDTAKREYNYTCRSMHSLIQGMRQQREVDDVLFCAAPGENEKPFSIFETRFHKARQKRIDICDLDPMEKRPPFPYECCFPIEFMGRHRPEAQFETVGENELVKLWINRADRRFAQPHFLMFAYHRIILQDMHNAVKLRVRQGTYTNLRPSQVCTKQAIDDYLQMDRMHRMYSTVKGTPAYMNEKRDEVKAMIRQLGMPTFMLTLSHDDLRDFDLLNTIAERHKLPRVTEETSSEERQRIIILDTLIASKHFHLKYDRFLRHVALDNKGKGILRGRNDWFYVVEAQHRPALHGHAMIWLYNAPKYGHATDQQVVDYIDSYITCEYDESLPWEVMRGQLHRHTFSCHKYGTDCRYLFPRVPLPRTMILHPLGDEDIPAGMSKRGLAKVWKRIHKAMTKYPRIPQNLGEAPEGMDRASDCEKAFVGWLTRLGLTEEEYILAVRASLRRTLVLVRRKPQEVWVNQYNRSILTLWEGNMDLQFLLHPYAVATYVTDYLTKSTEGFSEAVAKLHREALQETETLQEFMRRVGAWIVDTREISLMSIAAHLQSLPIYRASVVSKWVSSSGPSRRIRVLKSRACLRELPDSADPCWPSCYERFERRGQELKDMRACLVDFVCAFNETNAGEKAPSEPDDAESLGGSFDTDMSIEQSETDNEDVVSDDAPVEMVVGESVDSEAEYDGNTAEEDLETDAEMESGGSEAEQMPSDLEMEGAAGSIGSGVMEEGEEEEASEGEEEAMDGVSELGEYEPKAYPGPLYDAGKYRLRKRARILRTYRVPYDETREDEWRLHMARLFYPWNNEKEVEDVVTDEVVWKKWWPEIESNAKRYNYQESKILEFERILRSVVEEVDSQRRVDRSGRTLEDEEEVYGVPSDLPEAHAKASKMRFPIVEDFGKRCENNGNLNSEQLDLRNEIMTRLKYGEVGADGKPERLNLFISGGAGTGKTFTLKTLVSDLCAHFASRCGSADKPTVLVLSPHNKAAYLCGGMTIYRAFCWSLRSRRLSEDTKSSLSLIYRHVQAVVIDEIGLCNAAEFADLNRSLRDVTGVPAFMGGLHCFFFGDFFQLEPVGRRYAFMGASEPESEEKKAGDKETISKGDRNARRREARRSEVRPLELPWMANMPKLAELKKVERHPNKQWADLLNRLREEKISENDEDFIKKRADPRNHHKRKDATFLVFFNDWVDEINQNALDVEFKDELLHTFVAVDRTLTESEDDKKARQELKTKKHHNVLFFEERFCTKVGMPVQLEYTISKDLTKSMTGTVREVKSRKNLEESVIWVEFGPEDGNSIRDRHPLHNDWIAVRPMSVNLPSGYAGRTVMRTQFPLRNARARTFYKSQGDTLNWGICDFRIKKTGKIPQERKNLIHGLVYQALSRFRYGERVDLRNFDLALIYVDGKVKRFMEKQRSPENTFRVRRPVPDDAVASFVFHNCMGLESHKKFLAKYGWLNEVDVALFAEARHRDSKNCLLQNLRKTKQHSSLVADSHCMYISSRTALTPPNVSDEDSGVLLNCSTEKYSFLCAYRRPQANLKLFCVRLQNEVQGGGSKPDFIVGDFNKHVADEETDSQRLFNLMESAGYKQIVTSATHLGGCGASAKTIDHVWVSASVRQRFEVRSTVVDAYWSDHAMVFWSLFPKHHGEATAGESERMAKRQRV